MAGWRTTPLPPDWDARKAFVFERAGYQCVTIHPNGKRCTGDGTLECHHEGDNDDHRVEKLSTRCGWCHGQLTAAQANAAKRRPRKAREAEKHPGLL